MKKNSVYRKKLQLQNNRKIKKKVLIVTIIGIIEALTEMMDEMKTEAISKITETMTEEEMVKIMPNPETEKDVRVVIMKIARIIEAGMVLAKLTAIIRGLLAIMNALTEEMANRGTTISESLLPQIKASFRTLQSKSRKNTAMRKNAVKARKEINVPKKTIFTKMTK